MFGNIGNHRPWPVLSIYHEVSVTVHFLLYKYLVIMTRVKIKYNCMVVRICSFILQTGCEHIHVKHQLHIVSHVFDFLLNSSTYPFLYVFRKTVGSFRYHTFIDWTVCLANQQHRTVIFSRQLTFLDSFITILICITHVRSNYLL